MKTTRGVLLLVVLAVVAIPVIVMLMLWWDAAGEVADAEKAGLVGAQSGAPLTVVERTIAIAEFEDSWNVRAVPCRGIAGLWASATGDNHRSGAAPGVSVVLATYLMQTAHAERNMRSELRRLLVACQLEQRYSDTDMLRAWLKHAYFGAGLNGVEDASRIVFGKSAAELDAGESARLAALLGGPRLRQHPDQWAERALSIEKRVSAVSQRKP